MNDRVRVGVDVGGTFTDVALAVGDRLTTAKVPSTDDQSVGVIEGIEKACREAGVDPGAIDEFAHATTVATNTLLEGDGATTALVTTEGFRDVLEIGRQDRPDLYDLDVERPDPIVPRRRRYEIDERATPDGIERSVDHDRLDELVSEIDDDVESVAVCLLHSYAHPENERAVAAALDDALDATVSASCDVLAEFREYERTATTAVDAYVTPTIDSYLERLEERAAASGIVSPRVMQSNGGIAPAAVVRERAVTTALSGPAAGVVGAGAIADAVDTTITDTAGDTTAEAVGEHEDGAPETGFVTFDMGGTSSDVSLLRGEEVERTTEGEIGGHPIGVPMVDVTTVGAGGGSIAWVDDGGALRVGPRSAGAEPGPACYGRGGTDPTVTDANLMLGYVGTDTDLGGELSLDVNAAENALSRLAEAAGFDGPIEAARGVYRVANANMTRAIRSVTVERGIDPRGLGLVAFGGAGPMHACALATELGIDRVLVPRAGGVLSAYGLLVAAEKQDAVRTHRERIADVDPDSVDDAYGALDGDVRERLAGPDPTVEREADLRYAGQSFELTVPVDDPFDPERVDERFRDAYAAAYGYRMDEPVELVNLRVTATGDREPIDPAVAGAEDGRIGSREAFFDDRFRDADVYGLEALSPGVDLAGPAIVEGDECTVVVPPSWHGSVGSDGTIDLQRGDRDV